MIYLYGAGSRSVLIFDLIRKKFPKTKIKITDDKKKLKIKNFIDKNQFLKEFNPKLDRLIICISNPKRYEKKFQTLKKKIKFKDLNPIVDKNVNLYSNVKIGKNSIILSGSVLGPNVKLGENVFIGFNTIINHDTKIGNFSTIGHGSNIASSVIVGVKCFLGVSTTVINNIKIANQTLIGSASNILKDCKKNSVYFGNPARWIKNNDK